MHRVLATAGLCGVLLAATAGSSVASAAAPSTTPVAAPGRTAAAELPRTAVAAIDVAHRVIVLADGRRLRYDGHDPVRLTIAYMTPDNVQFTTTVTRIVPAPAWYAVVEGTLSRPTRLDDVQLTLVTEPTPQTKARCAMVTGDESAGLCARPDGTSGVTWTGARTGGRQS